MYFYGGDFAAAHRRHRAGEPESYAGHDDLLALCDDLIELDCRVRLVTFVSPEATTDRPIAGLEIVTLGMSGGLRRQMVRSAVRADTSDFIVTGFPQRELLSAALTTRARLLALLADSFNGRSLRSRLSTRSLVRLLSHERFEWVSNHCEPATLQLADLGVPRSKLIPWNIPFSITPASHPAKSLGPGPTRRLFYAGLIAEEKGVGDLLRAVARLDGRGRPVEVRLAGSGAVDQMRALARDLGVEARVELLGQVDNPTVRRLMRASDLVIVPSRRTYPEGLPFTLFEGLASRTPIVCSDHPMFVRHFVDGSSASQFRAGDPEALARAIELPLTDPDLYRRLSESAEATWAALGHTADRRTMVRTWVADEHPTAWLQRHALGSR